MPLLDILLPSSCFSNSTLEFRPEGCSGNKFSIRYDGRLRFTNWGDFHVNKKVVKTFKLGGPELRRGGLMINAVGTLEITRVVANHSQVMNGYENVLKMDNGDTVIPSTFDSESPSSVGESDETNEREKLRRMRISKANKGNTPWNKGRKHSPETIQRIKERTRLAMRDPKVKMKLITLGHAQSDETKVKIGVGVRLGWERRRERLSLQETCLYEWQDLIAGAARKGLLGDDELQWNSYEILSKQHQLEWAESVEERRRNPRPKGNKRAPKSAEKKRRIAESIAAKWADPEYRNRVCSGLAKYHGTPEGIERRQNRRPNVEGQVHRSRPKKDVHAKHETKSQAQKVVPKRSKAPSYKDPMASHKLEMLKSIKAQRAATTDTGSEAISRARMLIDEAEKAANALEVAAGKSPLAYSSLMESKKLIAEAIAVIESIDKENGEDHLSEDTRRFKNGNGNSRASLDELRLGEFMVNGKSSKHEDEIRCNGFPSQILDEGSTWKKEIKVVKKWVRGRLVEVEEET